MAISWDAFEQSTAFCRPSDWRDRPDGPDEVDLAAAELSRASWHAVSRADLLHAAAIQPKGSS